MRTSRRATVTLALIALAVGLIAPPAHAAAPSDVVELTSPASGQTVKGNPVLRWTSAVGAVKYRVQVSASASFATILYSADTAGLGATPTADLPAGAIYWRVAATDGSSGVGPFVAASFTQESATQPQLLSPADGSELAYPSTTPVLRWSPVAGVTSYRVELDDAPSFPAATVTTTANTALALSAPLILGKEYSWRVQGLSATAGVTTEYSPTWRFTTSWPDSSGKPVLTSPIGGATEDVTDVVFRWSAIAGAAKYQLQVNSNPDFTNGMIEDRVVKGTQYSPATTYNNATYYWRVRPQDTATPTPHYGPWSEVGIFKRSWLSQPELVSPRDSAFHDDQRFEWTPIPGATYYEVMVSSDPTFPTGTLTKTCTTYGTTLTATVGETLTSGALSAPPVAGCPVSLSPGTRYYWHVRGIDKPAGVNGVWSDSTDFYYVPDSTPTLLAPADHAQVSAPVLSWAPLAGYGRYRVTVVKPTGTLVADTYSTTYAPTAELKVGSSYEWWVVGLNKDGRPGVSGVHRTFTAVAPDSSVTAVTATSVRPIEMPSMTWPAIAGAKYYSVFVGSAVSGIFDAVPANGTTKVYQAAYTHASSVYAPGDYLFYARGYDQLGAAVGDSETGAFSIEEISFAGYLAPPNCVLPDCVAEHPNTPELSWPSVPGAYSYEVHVALDKDFTNEVYAYTTGETSLTPRESYLDNTAGQSYFWYVRPCKAAGRCGPFGGVSLLAREQAFRKKSAPAVLLAPANGAAVGDVVSFSWQEYRTSAPVGVGARQYKVQVATDSAFQDVVDTAIVDQTSYQAWGSTYPDGVYYWRVQALDGEQAGLTYSDWRQFTKSSAAPTPVPTDAAATGLPTMQWAALPYASAYGVEVFTGTSPAFPSGSRVLATTTKLAAYAPVTALAAGWYSWRVRKIDPDGHPGPWSPGTPTFAVRQPAPQLIAPADGASFATSDLLFTWDAVAGAASYRFESSTSAAFATTLEKVTTVMTSWAPVTSYVDGQPYSWRVSVLDGAGNVMAVSAVRGLTKDAAKPRVTAVSPTSKLAPDGTITVTFSEPVLGIAASSLTVTAATGAVTPIPAVLTPNARVAAATATITPLAPLIPGQFYDVHAGAGITDAVGNAAEPSTTRIQVALAIDSASPAITERWDVDASTRASGGAYMAARQAGSTATFSFSGAVPVSLLGRTSPAGGTADVLLDGVKKATVSFYSAAETHHVTRFAGTAVGAGAHTLTVRVLGGKPAGSTSTYVDIDAFTAAGVTYQETSAAVKTGFARMTTASAAGGSYDTTTQELDSSGAEYRFTFRGKGFTWQATKVPGGGTATVYIDGAAKGTVSLYAAAAAFKAVAYNSAALADGVHTVRLVLTGAVPKGSSGTLVSVDGVTVR